MRDVPNNSWRYTSPPLFFYFPHSVLFAFLHGCKCLKDRISGGGRGCRLPKETG
jgi:hypothetical protein